MTITITGTMIDKVDNKLLELTNDSVFYTHVSNNILCSEGCSLSSRFTQLRNFSRSGHFTPTGNLMLTISLWDHYAEEFNLPRIQSNSELRPINFYSTGDWDRAIRRYLKDYTSKSTQVPRDLQNLIEHENLKEGDMVRCVVGDKKAGRKFIVGDDFRLVRSRTSGKLAVLLDNCTYSTPSGPKFIHIPNVNPCQEITLETDGYPCQETKLETNNTGEKQMNTLTKYQGTLITSVTLLNGIDVSELTEADFITKIQGIQSEIKGYDGLPKSTHVSSRVKQLKEDLDAVVKLMDETLGAESK